MKIFEPCIITSRLLPGIKVDDGTVSIKYGHRDSKGRQCYVVSLDTDEIDFENHSLASGAGGGSLQEGLRSALSFMEACGESVNFSRRTGMTGEQEDLFPSDVAAWCARHVDELGMAVCCLEETESLIVE